MKAAFIAQIEKCNFGSEIIALVNTYANIIGKQGFPENLKEWPALKKSNEYKWVMDDEVLLTASRQLREIPRHKKSSPVTVKISNRQIDLLQRSMQMVRLIANKRMLSDMSSYYDEDAGVFVSESQFTPFMRTTHFAAMSLMEAAYPLLEKMEACYPVVSTNEEYETFIDEPHEVRISGQDALFLKTHGGALIQSVFVYIQRDKDAEIENELKDVEFYGTAEQLNEYKNNLKEWYVLRNKKDRGCYKSLCDMLSDL